MVDVVVQVPDKPQHGKFNGEALEAIRKANGMSLQDLSERLGVAKSTISRWERNQLVPHRKHWKKLARFLKVRHEVLFKE